tara:strand:+ start:362 stop:574 length:213 start_codon:yes stop_codon:yes gene_type:complete
MKITRLKKGYVIRVTDAEFSVLDITMQEGMGSGMWIDLDHGHLSPAEKRIINEVSDSKRDWMVITENRRG